MSKFVGKNIPRYYILELHQSTLYLAHVTYFILWRENFFLEMEFSGINFMILLFVCCCYKYVYFVWIWKSKQIWKESKQIFCLPTFDVHKQWNFRTLFTLNYFMLPMLTSVHCKGLKLAEGLKINDFPTKFPIFVHKKSAFLMREATVSKQQLSYFVLRLRTSRPKHTSCLYNERHTYTDTPVAHWAEFGTILKYKESTFGCG